MHNYLEKILDQKKQVVQQLRQDMECQAVLESIIQGEHCPADRTYFKCALAQPGLGVIAEIKRHSPSKGPLAAIRNPVQLAQEYELGGAVAISVLTDQFGFNGSVGDLVYVRQAVNIPVLRKDFIIDMLQIAEAIYYGARAVLLIVAILGDQTSTFIEACDHMGIEALVEVHTAAELKLALDAGAKIIGVNNRNLETFEVDMNTAFILRELIPVGVQSVAESGIHSLEMIKRYKQAQFDAVLIGEALVRASSAHDFLKAVQHV